MVSIGVRELKAHLSRTLRHVRTGARVEVTEHGRPIAVIVPIDPAPNNVAWAHALVSKRQGHWNGAKLGDRVARPIPLRGRGPLASDIILEDRR